jgi:hypothetical protein
MRGILPLQSTAVTRSLPCAFVLLVTLGCSSMAENQRRELQPPPVQQPSSLSDCSSTDQYDATTHRF